MSVTVTPHGVVLAGVGRNHIVERRGPNICDNLRSLCADVGSNLSRLDIHLLDSYLTDDVVIDVFDTLKELYGTQLHHKLHEVWLRGNMLTDNFAKRLCPILSEILGSGSNVSWIDVSNNRLTHRGVVEMLKVLSCHCDKHIIFFTWCGNMCDMKALSTGKYHEFVCNDAKCVERRYCNHDKWILSPHANIQILELPPECKVGLILDKTAMEKINNEHMWKANIKEAKDEILKAGVTLIATRRVFEECPIQTADLHSVDQHMKEGLLYLLDKPWSEATVYRRMAAKGDGTKQFVVSATGKEDNIVPSIPFQDFVANLKTPAEMLEKAKEPNPDALLAMIVQVLQRYRKEDPENISRIVETYEMVTGEKIFKPNVDAPEFRPVPPQVHNGVSTDHREIEEVLFKQEEARNLGPDAQTVTPAWDQEPEVAEQPKEAEENKGNEEECKAQTAEEDKGKNAEGGKEEEEQDRKANVAEGDNGKEAEKEEDETCKEMEGGGAEKDTSVERPCEEDEVQSPDVQPAESHGGVEPRNDEQQEETGEAVAEHVEEMNVVPEAGPNTDSRELEAVTQQDTEPAKEGNEKGNDAP